MTAKPTFQYRCPGCGARFPFWMNSSNLVRRGFFFMSTRWFKCSHCETVSRLTLSWPHALWAYPLVGLTVISVFASFWRMDGLIELHRNNPVAHEVLMWLCVGLGMMPIRYGLKLRPVFGLPKH